MEVLQPPPLFHRCMFSFAPPPPLPDLRSHSTPDDEEKERKKTEKASGVWWRQEDHFRFKANQRYIETLSQDKENQRVCNPPPDFGRMPDVPMNRAS